MSDTSVTIAELRRLVEEFVEHRDWHQFHTPKNLAMSLAIEAAELMEHFQWLTPEQSQAVITRPEELREVAEELADVLCYALAMANDVRERFPWASQVNHEEIQFLIDGLKSRLVDTVITRSTNRELNHHLY